MAHSEELVQAFAADTDIRKLAAHAETWGAEQEYTGRPRPSAEERAIFHTTRKRQQLCLSPSLCLKHCPFHQSLALTVTSTAIQRSSHIYCQDGRTYKDSFLTSSINLKFSRSYDLSYPQVKKLTFKPNIHDYYVVTFKTDKNIN